MQPSYHGALPNKPSKKVFLHPSGRIPKDELELPSKKSSTPTTVSKKGNETTPLLINYVRLAKETEDIATKTMQAVEEQGETIDSAVGHVSSEFNFKSIFSAPSFI
ncbi:hypothetical protein EON64_15225, partial [archaeon]